MDWVTIAVFGLVAALAWVLDHLLRRPKRSLVDDQFERQLIALIERNAALKPPTPLERDPYEWFDPEIGRRKP